LIQPTNFSKTLLFASLFSLGHIDSTHKNILLALIRHNWQEFAVCTSCSPPTFDTALLRRTDVSSMADHLLKSGIFLDNSVPPG
jgi:hypothetical protein